MLIIRKEQMECFARYELEGYQARLQMHLQAFFPLPTGLAGDAAITAFVGGAIEQARGYGFDTVATVQSFADHTILLGWDFCRNPLYSALTTTLFDPDIASAIQRHDLLYERAWTYLDATRGPDAGNLLQATARLNAWLAIPNKRAPTSLSDLLEILALIYPQKHAAHDTETLSAFCREAVHRARADGFQEPVAQTIYASAAFLSGLGFFHDPLIRGAVADHLAELAAETRAAGRTAILAAAATAYAEKVIAQVRAATALDSES
ncbi:hypothetical protein [uncultured Thiodictyon sp.]|uniref:hypothetical protein n=1 Tax=uncultured Thiodictyon sp. TaxID=1846217 RepID=UPI0025ECB109|nr:hypothetical protein [uncultured Thiodictyon sp.]